MKPKSSVKNETSNKKMQLIQQPSTSSAVAIINPVLAVSSPSKFEQLISRYIDPQFMRNNFPNVENLIKYFIGSLTLGAGALICALEIGSGSGPSHISFDLLQNFLSPPNLSFIPIEAFTVSVTTAAFGIGCINNGPTGRANYQSIPSSGETAASSIPSANFELPADTIGKMIREHFEVLVNLLAVRKIRWLKILSSTLMTLVIGAKLWDFCKKVLLVDELKEENAIVLEIRKNLSELGSLMIEGDNRFEGLRQQIMEGKFVSSVTQMEKLYLHIDKIRQIINKTTPLLLNLKLKVNGKVQELEVKKEGMLKRGIILGGISVAIWIAIDAVLAFGIATPVSTVTKYVLAGKTTAYAALTGLQLTLNYNFTKDELETARTKYQEIVRLIADLDDMNDKVDQFSAMLLDFIDQHETANGVLGYNPNQAQLPVTGMPFKQLTQ